MIIWTALALGFLGIGGDHGHRPVDFSKAETNPAKYIKLAFISFPVAVGVGVGFKMFGVYCAIKAVPLWFEFIRAL